MIGTLFLALCARAMFFPGGGLYDTNYDHDRVLASMVQQELEEYKIVHKAYPTTEQGLQALVEQPSSTESSNDHSYLKYARELKYVSDGITYEIENDHPYSIPGLVVRGTNDSPSKLFIRDQ